MLQKETVSKATLELLKSLMDFPGLKDFFLVGGTALSLQIGHRISIDIDLFSLNSFDDESLLAQMEKEFGFILDFRSANTLKGEINGIKVDLITHSYPLVKPLLLFEGVRLCSLEDIAAMKLNAICGNGTRLKDFTDIAYLSSYLTLAQMLDAYAKKYATRNPAIVVKSLGYHQDIDFNEPIEIAHGKFQWRAIEKRLLQMTKSPGILFEPMK